MNKAKSRLILNKEGKQSTVEKKKEIKNERRKKNIRAKKE